MIADPDRLTAGGAVGPVVADLTPQANSAR